MNDESDGKDARGSHREHSLLTGDFFVDVRGPPSHPGKLRFADEIPNLVLAAN